MEYDPKYLLANKNRKGRKQSCHSQAPSSSSSSSDCALATPVRSSSLAHPSQNVNNHEKASERRDSGVSMNENDSVATTKAKKPEIWWFVVGFVFFFHLVSAGSIIFYQSPKQETVALVFATWFVCMLGITAGYHRLWSHRAYQAAAPVRIFLALAGAAAYQGSIKWWVLRHRLHHRYTDTDHDPYDSTKGFFYSHMGWMFEKQEYPRMKWIDKSDLDGDFVVRLQHKIYPILAISLGLLLPTYIGSLWGDALGGFLYGGFVSRIVIWHCTWFINSLAHAWGDQEFSHESSARGNTVLSVLTLGEGYHSFHHQFPRDYRNGIALTDFDPTKWFIASLSYFNLTQQLKKIPIDVILKAQITAAEEKLHIIKQNLIWSDLEKLPVWSLAEFEDEAAKSNALIMIDGFAVDVSLFSLDHPGGKGLIVKYIGKDATKSFNGLLNNHTKSAMQIVKDLSVAKVVL